MIGWVKAKEKKFMWYVVELVDSLGKNMNSMEDKLVYSTFAFTQLMMHSSLGYTLLIHSAIASFSGQPYFLGFLCSYLYIPFISKSVLNVLFTCICLISSTTSSANLAVTQYLIFSIIDISCISIFRHLTTSVTSLSSAQI